MPQTEDNQNNIDTPELEEALQVLPTEVKTFLYKGEFEKKLEEASQKLNLSKEQLSSLQADLILVISQIEEKDALLKLCDRWGFSTEQKCLFVSVIETLIFEPLVEKTNYIIEDVPVIESMVSPVQALINIQQRLSQNTVMTPTNRDYSFEKETPDQKKPISTVDPYRETPEK